MLTIRFSFSVNVASSPYSVSRSGGSPLSRERDFVVVAVRVELIRRPERLADRRLLMAEIHGGAQRQLDAVDAAVRPGGRARAQLVHHVDGVLHVRQEHALLDDEAFHVVSPDRQAGLEAELHEIPGPLGVRRVRGAFAAANLDLPAADPNLLGDVTQHDGPAEWRAERRDQRSVVPARDDAGHGSRGVAAEAIGDQPLAGDQRLGIGHAGNGPWNAANRFGRTAGSVMREPSQRRGRRTSGNGDARPRGRRDEERGRTRQESANHHPARRPPCPPPPYLGSSLDHWRLQSDPGGGADQRVGKRFPVEQRAEIDDQQRGRRRGSSVKNRSANALRRQHTAVDASRPLRAERRLVATQLQQVGVKRIRRVRASTRSVKSSLQRSKVRGSPGSSSGAFASKSTRLGNCRRNSARPSRTAAASSGS